MNFAENVDIRMDLLEDSKGKNVEEFDNSFVELINYSSKNAPFAFNKIFY